ALVTFWQDFWVECGSKPTFEKMWPSCSLVRCRRVSCNKKREGVVNLMANGTEHVFNVELGAAASLANAEVPANPLVLHLI
ncbi:MAG: hypothetical protein KGZ75_05730, partial [Syntrophomonadaceae bacterium]|nr:hypothetical protein [Syntrophomonadaceae bacterium]